MSIGERQGSFASMAERCELKVRLVSAENSNALVQKVIYDGSAIKVSF